MIGRTEARLFLKGTSNPIAETQASDGSVAFSLIEHAKVMIAHPIDAQDLCRSGDSGCGSFSAEAERDGWAFTGQFVSAFHGDDGLTRGFIVSQSEIFRAIEKCTGVAWGLAAAAKDAADLYPAARTQCEAEWQKQVEDKLAEAGDDTADLYTPARQLCEAEGQKEVDDKLRAAYSTGLDSAARDTPNLDPAARSDTADLEPATMFLCQAEGKLRSTDTSHLNPAARDTRDVDPAARSHCQKRKAEVNMRAAVAAELDPTARLHSQHKKMRASDTAELEPAARTLYEAEGQREIEERLAVSAPVDTAG